MKYTIGELAEIIDGDRGKNYPQQNEFFDSGYCLFLNTGNVTNQGFSFEQNQFITKEKCDILRKGKLQRGDIVYTTRGTVGNAAYYSETIEFEHIRINSGMVIIRPYNTVVDTRFLYQILKSVFYRSYFKQFCTGSAQPQLPIKNLSKIVLDIPALAVQNRIADILCAYDDLIENNQKQIKLLEEAAQRLYKEWFVDLRFPGYENTLIIDGVPQGWKKVSLGELIEYEIGGGWGEDQPTEKCDIPAYVIRGTDLYDVTHGNAKSIPYRFHAKSNLDSRKLQDGDIVFEVSGGSKNEGVARTALITASILDFLGGDVICASFCKLIRFKDKSLAKYMYDTFQHLRNSGETVKYDKRSASSIVNYRWKDFLEQQFIFVPTTDILTQYNALAENMQKAIVNKAQIIEQSKQARDRLLPKLMSGEIDLFEKKPAEILQHLPKLSYDEFLSELGMAARARTISEADLRAMYEAYLDDDAEDRD